MEAGMNDYLHAPLRLVPMETAVQKACPLQQDRGLGLKEL